MKRFGQYVLVRLVIAANFGTLLYIQILHPDRIVGLGHAAQHPGPIGRWVGVAGLTFAFAVSLLLVDAGFERWRRFRRRQDVRRGRSRGF